MAWITQKSSAPNDLGRRAVPYLAPATKDRFERDFIPRYPTRRGALIQVLHAIQDEVGWLPMQAMEEVAQFIGITPSQVVDTATFYEEFFFKPRGKYTLWVCQSVSCEIMGSTALQGKISEKLGIHHGETTPDGKFTLMHVECIGACGGGPCALCNHKLHENLSPDNVDAILDSLP